MKFSKIVCCILLLSLVLSIWAYELDLTFIGNSLYHYFLWRIIPLISAISFLVILIVCFRQYKKSKKFREKLKLEIETEGKFNSIIFIICSPVLTWGLVWGLIGAPMKIWSYYGPNSSWSQMYHLKRVTHCNEEDYGPACTNLLIQDIQTNNKSEFRWYGDKQLLLELQNQNVRLTGTITIFGFFVDSIEW